MFVRHHFLDLMGYMLVLSIFFLNYFDKYTIKVTLALLGISAMLDLVWLIAEANVNKILLSLIGIVMDRRNIPLSSRDS
jgi:hypothetical protein